MKKVIFWLCFALAIFLPTSNQAKELNPAPHFKPSQAEITLHNDQSVCDTILYNDLLEDESDDNLPESERKKITAGKSQFDNTFSLAFNASDDYFKKELYATTFFNCRTSRCIFFSVLRL